MLTLTWRDTAYRHTWLHMRPCAILHWSVHTLPHVVFVFLSQHNMLSFHVFSLDPILLLLC